MSNEKPTNSRSLADNQSLSLLREKVLRVLLGVGLVIALAVFIPMTIMSVREGYWLLAALNFTTYGCALGVFFFRKIDYNARAKVTLALAYGMGLYISLLFGPLSSGPYCLFAFAVLAGLLLGMRAAIAALAINAITLFALGWLMIQGGERGLEITAHPSLLRGVVAWATILLMNASAAFSAAALVEGMRHLAEREQAVNKELRQKHADLSREMDNRAKAEQALRKSEDQYRLLAENVRDIIWAYSLETLMFTYVSPSVYASRGFSVEEALTHSMEEVVTPESLARINQVMGEELKRDGQPGVDPKRYRSMEIQQLNKDGSYSWAEVTVSFIRDESGRPIGLAGVTRDIDERKRMEEALQVSYENLTKSQKISHVGNWTWDIAADMFTASAEGLRLYGFSPGSQPSFQEIAGRIHPDDRMRARAVLTESLRTGEPYKVEVRIFKKDTGELRHILSMAEIERSQDGAPVRVFGINQDITERKQAEEEREKLQAQLIQAQKMESVGRLAGGVAHDFNNMLGVILGRAEMALMQVDKNQPIHADLMEIQHAAQRSADLTRQLLAFARKQTVAPMVLNLNDTIDSMLTLLRRLIGEDVELAWLPGKGLWPIKMDPAQIDQILANLCVNARDAIAGVGKVIIRTDNAVLGQDCCARHTDLVPGDYVLLSVSDDGCGMDSETISHLFEPFFTTKEVGQGTGLGLATVYGAVKQNKGFVTVVSEAGQGATFNIYLPRHGAAGEYETRERRQAGAVGGSETILLVEDEPAILRMSLLMLERLGYSVLAAHSPGEAIRLAKEHSGRVDLLITDVVMPEMNGRDLTNQLLSIHPAVRWLYMSGYPADVIAHQGLLEPGVHFIQKPFSMKSLGAKIREVLENAYLLA